jgi:hypothetical protein
VSHYIKVKTKFRDAAALVEALKEQFPECKIDHLAAAEKIRGYQGKRGAACSIIVRKLEGQGVGPRYGDLGFALEEDGTFVTHRDDYDRTVEEGLAQRYARTVAVKQARLSGFTVSEVKAADGTITLNLSKWS